MRPLLLVRSITVSAGFNVFNFSSMLNLSVLLSILMNLGLNNNSDICRRCEGETWRIEADLSLRGQVRNTKMKEESQGCKIGTHFEHFYIWDQFWTHSARVEAIQHAAAQLAENGN